MIRFCFYRPQKCSSVPPEMEAFLNSFHLLSTYCIPSAVLYRFHSYYLFNPDNGFEEGGIIMILVLQMRKLSFIYFEFGW